MASQTELVTDKYLAPSSDSDMSPASAYPPVVRSVASQVMTGMKNFLIVVTFVALLSTVGKWAVFAAAESTTVADWCLWVAGSDKTWEQYQQDHIRKGHPRLNDKDAPWVQQLFQDAYAGNNR